jgi:importin subunit alpha-1
MYEQTSRTEFRNREFMSTIDPASLKQRNEQFAIDLRKQKRSENQFKRRAIMISETLSTDQMIEIPSELLSLSPQLADPSLHLDVKLAALYSIISHVQEEDKIYSTLFYCRKLLSASLATSPIKQFVEAGFIPVFVHFTNPKEPERIFSEASWCLCNIASGDSRYTRAVVEAKGLEAFASLLKTENHEVTEHAIWGIGNIAGENVDGECPYKNRIIELDVIEKLTNLTLTAKLSKKMKVVISWTLGNIARTKPELSMGIVQEIIPAARKLLRSNSKDVVVNALWTLSHINANGSSTRIQSIINNEILQLVVPRLKEPLSRIQHPALRVIGNVLLGDYIQSQTVINMKILDDITGLLTSTDKKVRQEAYWALSNITAGTKDQVKDVISQPVITVAMKGLNDPVFTIRKEASWVFSNIIYTGAREDKLALVDLDIFTHLRESYSNSDPRYLMVTCI